MSVVLDKETLKLASKVVKLDAKREELRATYRKFALDLRHGTLFVLLPLGKNESGYKYSRSWRVSSSLFPNEIREHNMLILKEAKEACNKEYLRYKKYTLRA